MSIEGQLKDAIDTNDLERVKTLMIRTPALHSAPLGYSKDGPLTWVAECRIPLEPPGPARLSMARYDGGLPMTELLLERGADLSIRVKLPGHYERPGEVVECTPLGYALLFPGEQGETVGLLRNRAAPV